ncbi:MAG: Gfo/Idh/MocA family oxidoreductase [Deltaproteobacteria bacterium]|nr:Gfo/Idh/MocA family oxidoreductase [Deltaproteobacteria bacterium]
MNSRKKSRVAVIGVGYLGKIHAEKYAMIEEAELVGVTDMNFGRAKEIAALTKTTAYPDYKDFFGKVDAVSIVTPTESHCKIGLEFLSKGVDVLMEKPIAVNMDEAEKLVRQAEQSKAVLQVGHLERFNAAIAALEGKIKDPVYIEAFRQSPFPNRSIDVDVVLDLMIHDIDIILSLVKSEVESVEAVGMRIISDKEDIANARLTFKNGCIANINANRAAKERVRKLNIFQPDACMNVDYIGQQLFISKIVPGANGAYATLSDEVPELAKRDSLLEELKAFLNCSVTRSTPPVSGIDGKKALEVAQRIQEAMHASASRFSRNTVC